MPTPPRKGRGTVTGDRVYRLVRHGGTLANHTFKTTFLDPGVQVDAFTFG